MLNSCCKATLLILLGFMVASNAEAKNQNNIIMCPGLNKIHEAASFMNHVECKKQSCNVFTDKPVFYENGVNWGIGVGVNASSENEAIMKAKNIAEGVTVLFTEISMNGLCIYFVGSPDQSDDEMIGMIAFGEDSKQQISPIPAFLKNQIKG